MFSFIMFFAGIYVHYRFRGVIDPIIDQIPYIGKKVDNKRLGDK